MTVKKLTDKPTINDTIVVDLYTPGPSIDSNPYSIESVLIYFIEVDRINNYQFIKNENAFYYKDAQLVWRASKPKTIAWTVEEPSKGLTNLLTEKGQAKLGHFGFIWQPKTLREGNYVVHWTWKPTNESKIKSAYKSFSLFSDRTARTSSTGRYTVPDKYEMLLSKYLPNVYKVQIVKDDLTPYVLKNFNACVAQGFTELEDLANQLIEILDADLTHHVFLPILANMFNIRLKTDDVCLWRRQISQAIPTFKKKGTYEGLKQALDQIEVSLNKITRLWQCVSKYYWTESFQITQDTDNKYSDDFGFIIGTLINKPFDNEIEVSIRPSGAKDYTRVSKNYISFLPCLQPTDPITVIWHKEAIDPEINLFAGDIVKITYKLQEVPPHYEDIEKYINDLPTADQRDESLQKHPIKNWNIKLIEETDPMFERIVSEKHPFQPILTYGKIRTKFLFSENTYNMDTYNGSLRDSHIPCDIDKDFLDSCSLCLSSSFNVDLDVKNLDEDKLLEIKNIIQEYSPFHAILHSMYIKNTVKEFVLSPTEDINSSIKANNRPDEFKEVIKQEETIRFKIKYKDGRVEEGKI